MENKNEIVVFSETKFFYIPLKNQTKVIQFKFLGWLWEYQYHFKLRRLIKIKMIKSSDFSEFYQ